MQFSYADVRSKTPSRKAVVLAYTLEQTGINQYTPEFVISVISPHINTAKSRIKTDYFGEPDFTKSTIVFEPVGKAGLIKGTTQLVHKNDEGVLFEKDMSRSHLKMMKSIMESRQPKAEWLKSVVGSVPPVFAAITEAEEEGGIAPHTITQTFWVKDDVLLNKNGGCLEPVRVFAMELNAAPPNTRAIDALAIFQGSLAQLRSDAKQGAMREKHFAFLEECFPLIQAHYQEKGILLDEGNADKSLSKMRAKEVESLQRLGKKGYIQCFGCDIKQSITRSVEKTISDHERELDA